MKAIRSLVVYVSLCLGPVLCAETPINTTIAKQVTNAVVTWDTVRGKNYILKVSTNLAQWFREPPLPTALNAVGNQFSYADPLTNQSRFYAVAKLDTEGPVVTSLSPL